MLQEVNQLSKIKIYEIAKELDVDNKDVIKIAKKLGVKVASHLSSIDDADAKKIRDNFKRKKIKKKKKILKQQVKL